MTITHSTPEDIPEIFRLYRLATDYQKIQFPDNLWPEFEASLIAQEIKEHRQFKISIDGQVACVWAIAFSDPVIWKEDDGVSSIYIHRIATNPDFRGRHFVQVIVDWARHYAREKNKQFVRLDTCGNNVRLIRHYEQCGFEFLGMKRLEDATGLPPHYQNADVCYFEIKLD